MIIHLQREIQIPKIKKSQLIYDEYTFFNIFFINCLIFIKVNKNVLKIGNVKYKKVINKY